MRRRIDELILQGLPAERIGGDQQKYLEENKEAFDLMDEARAAESARTQ